MQNLLTYKSEKDPLGVKFIKGALSDTVFGAFHYIF